MPGTGEASVVAEGWVGEPDEQPEAEPCDDDEGES